jgi:hypothetical protein
MRVVAILFVTCLIVWLVTVAIDERVPAHVGGYVSYCPSHVAACEAEVEQVSSALMMEYMPGTQYCPSKASDIAKDEQHVRDWLFAHSGLRNASVPTGIRMALLSENPCH